VSTSLENALDCVCTMFMQVESKMSKQSLDFDATPALFSIAGF
jgi:hypothetical protein